MGSILYERNHTQGYLELEQRYDTLRDEVHKALEMFASQRDLSEPLGEEELTKRRIPESLEKEIMAFLADFENTGANFYSDETNEMYDMRDYFHGILNLYAGRLFLETPFPQKPVSGDWKKRSIRILSLP